METQQILSLWRKAKQQGDSLFLATLVYVQGSSYRKPGARMLISSSGERAGTISGGCLEAGIAKKIAWLTRNGPLLQHFKSLFDEEDSVPSYGLGCNGTLSILMETGEQVAQTMLAIERAWELSVSSAQVIDGLHSGNISSEIQPQQSLGREESCRPLVTSRFGERAIASRSPVLSLDEHSNEPELVALPILPPPHLHIFGAGDDAQPIARIAQELGGRITVLDGRVQLLKRYRFPGVRNIRHLEYELGEPRELATHLSIGREDLAVLVTHSYDQDRALLKSLLPLSLRYLGVLGPLHRTKRLLAEICGEVMLSPDEAMARLHAPVGLRIGAGSPGVISLAILAEMQSVLASESLAEPRQCSRSEFSPFDRSQQWMGPRLSLSRQ